MEATGRVDTTCVHPVLLSSNINSILFPLEDAVNLLPKSGVLVGTSNLVPILCQLSTTITGMDL